MRISDWSSDVCSSDLSYATYRRTHTTPAHGTGFADLTQAVFFVSDFAYGGAAVDVDATDFAGAQAHLSISTFTSQQDSRRPGGASHLSTLARKHFDAERKRGV